MDQIWADVQCRRTGLQLCWYRRLPAFLMYASRACLGLSLGPGFPCRGYCCQSLLPPVARKVHNVQQRLGTCSRTLMLADQRHSTMMHDDMHLQSFWLALYMRGQGFGFDESC